MLECFNYRGVSVSFNSEWLFGTYSVGSFVGNEDYCIFKQWFLCFLVRSLPSLTLPRSWWLDLFNRAKKKAAKLIRLLGMRQPSLSLGIEKQAKQDLGLCACLEKSKLKISSAVLQKSIRTTFSTSWGAAHSITTGFTLASACSVARALLGLTQQLSPAQYDSGLWGWGTALERQMKAHLVFKWIQLFLNMN